MKVMMNKHISVGRPLYAAFALVAWMLATWAMTPPAALAAFGLTSSGGIYTVDTGAGLVFKVDASGNLISLKYNNGPELQDQSKSSGIASGFYVYGADTVTVTPTTFGTDTLMLTVNDVAPSGSTGQLIHYYIVRKGVNNITMATYITQEPNVGELRYIMRLLYTQLPNTPVPSDLTGNTGAIESSDVFGLADGETRSKYYGRGRALELSTRGVTGSGVGVYMIYGSRESSSGGPFYRDIQNQTGTDSELYTYMNSGHEQTEAVRTSVLNGPYVYAFTNGSAPAIPDLSFVASLGLTGYVGSTGRGSVSISGIGGRDSNFAYTVGFANPTAQYWATADAATGAAVCAGMKPGTYTMTLYKGELAIYTSSVSVTAGSVTPVGAITITTDPSCAIPIWRIGDWDGSPREFLNGDKITDMHPSDVRLDSWTPGTYVVGTATPATDFPCYQWKDVNGTQAVQFTLAASQIAASTVRIGITCAYAGARPQISVNAWTSSVPSSSAQPDSRSMTVGTYRGNNAFYTYAVPASAFVAGQNTLSISPASGSSGTTYLSPGYSVDCVDLIAPTRTVSGTVSLQGWAGTPQSLTFTLTPTGGTAGTVTTQILTPSASGAFTLTGVPAGSYTLGVKGSKWLRRSVAVSTTSGNVSGLSLTLPAGDVNNDNQVSGIDSAMLRAAYGTSAGQTRWNANADLNGDGQVSGVDSALLKANYGKQGNL